MAHAFDTLGYARKLEGGGVARAQAEAHAEAAREFILTEVAAKADIERLEERLDHARTELTQKIENAKLLTIIAIAGFNAALFGGVLVIVKLMLP